MNLTGKTVLVVGAARSGIEACRFLLTQHARIILSDSKDRSQLDEEVLALEKKGVKLMLGRQFANNVTWDLVVCSPGVPPMLPG